MNIIIQIDYKASGNQITQSSSFYSRGRQPEKVALEWWKQIKKEASYHAELIKVIVDSERDITQLVKDLEEKEWKTLMNDHLPF